MNREVYTSKDGSKTIYWAKYDEHYHSVNGALTESLHVFIEAGLAHQTKKQDSISIFEMGFGSGLNALLTYAYAHQKKLTINYTSIEAFPIEQELQHQLGFSNLIDIETPIIEKIYTADWNKTTPISETFSLTKIENKIQEFNATKQFDLIYYDAFAPSAQPELWTIDIFEKLYQMLNKNGSLTTYCAKGQVKRDLKATGFEIESLPGPPGKREMTRAIKQ